MSKLILLTNSRCCYNAEILLMRHKVLSNQSIISRLSECKKCIYSTEILYLTQRVGEGIMFLTRPSVSLSIGPSVLFSCQRNSSETAQQNFVELCSYEGYNVQMRISTGNLDSIFFLRVTTFLNLFTLLNVHRVVNSWVGFPHKIQEHRSPTNNDDSTAFILLR